MEINPMIWNATNMTLAPKYPLVGASTIGSCNPPTFAITAAVPTNGALTPTGVTNVASGGSQVYTITPNIGYVRSSVLIDGVNNSAAVTTGSYTVANVTAPHTISATFAASGVQVNFTKQ